VGDDAYIKGANKLKNLTINSSFEAPSQIGEGCELVNGIVGFGCRIFYGVKAVRFIMASYSQLKYGARLINSYLGNNATISCCEVLNSLIFPAHEQHHNNSFLCAATVMGQSNMAAGATIGSNHNSRAADGEIVAGRGFWPGLCVSLKHNSKFATFTLIAKGDYSAELNIPLPFSLVSNDITNNKLVVMPAYWFMYNMYALARNAHKYIDRDKRIEKIQHIEYDFLAPDSVNEIFEALHLLQKYAAIADDRQNHIQTPEDALASKGKALLEDPNTTIQRIEITDSPFEAANRPTCIAKAPEAYRIYKELVVYYAVTNMVWYIEAKRLTSFQELKALLPEDAQRLPWKNIGGQLLPEPSLQAMIQGIKDGTINSWGEVHDFYQENGSLYKEQKLQHAFASLLEIRGISAADFTFGVFSQLMQEAVATKEWMTKNIYQSRAKDYQSEFRKMVYDNEQEMEEVIGRLDENTFISQQEEELEHFRRQVQSITDTF
jgi:hypothetical protein